VHQWLSLPKIKSVPVPWWRFSPSIRADEFSVRTAGIFCENSIRNGST
jgi:hypothetical protein